MKRIIHPLLLLLAKAPEKELVLMIEYLKAENKILRSKLPKRVEVTAAEKATLTKLGVRLGSAIKNLITIVHPRSFARWLADTKTGAKEKKARGRPRKPEETRQLVMDMAKESGWGYRRIFGELKKLGIKFISRSTVARILQENPFAERFVQMIKQECLDHFVVFGGKHLRTILAAWLEYYHFRRPHQGLANVLISGEAMPEIPIEDFRRESVVCHETLGGLLKHYEREAA